MTALLSDCASSGPGLSTYGRGKFWLFVRRLRRSQNSAPASNATPATPPTTPPTIAPVLLNFCGNVVAERLEDEVGEEDVALPCEAEANVDEAVVVAEELVELEPLAELRLELEDVPFGLTRVSSPLLLIHTPLPDPQQDVAFTPQQKLPSSQVVNAMP